MKFKLVKSNSCSSRLELAGTGSPNPKIFDQEMIKAIEMKMNPSRTPPPTTEEEETVRDMIYKLEGKKEGILNIPRIIESKCIEKIYPENNRVDDTVTINNQMIEIPKVEELKEEIVEHPSNLETNLLSDSVTVNNHISYTAAPMLKKEDANYYPEEKSKVVRNRNVDLAFSASLQQGNNKPIKDKENLARKVSSSMSKLSSKENVNENESRSDSKLTKWDSAGKLESIEMVKKQEKKNQPLGNSAKSSIELPSALKSSNSTGNKTTKMVNWSTVGKVDKEYFANDRTLVTGKKYDEMEFEEFEVLGEQHYDSLNSK